MADRTEEIEALEELLNTGATRIENDGTKVEVDLDQARRRLRELRAEDDEIGEQRPPFANIFLGGF